MEINNPRGILLMALGMALFAVADTIAKVLLEHYPPAQVIFLFGLRTIPIADATAIAFIAPLFVIIFSYFILKEPIGIRRWLAVAIGFSGTLIIIRPGFEVINLGHLFIIIAALLFALRQIISRLLAATDDPVTTAFFTAYTSVFIFLLFQPWVWTPITNTNHIFLFLFMQPLLGQLNF